MHVKAKRMAFGGLLLSLTVICMMLGSIIESNTLFLLAAASFFVGIMVREFGFAAGTAFYLAGVLLGFLTAPNKLYVISYAAMGLYILAVDYIRQRLGKMSGTKSKRAVFWTAKYVIFNLLFIPSVIGFQELLFAGRLPFWALIGVLLAGQAGLFLYDRAYEYVQAHLWSRIRGKLM